MHIPYRVLLLSFVFSIFIYACSSDDPSPASCETQQSNLTGGSSKTWGVSSINVPIKVVDDEDSTTQIFSGTFDILNLPFDVDFSETGVDFECVTDNTVTFNDNGGYTASEGAVVCEGIPATGTGTWEFSENWM